MDIGAVLEERGTGSAEYVFTNVSGQPLYIEDIITDCGCTTAEYTKDTLLHEQQGQIKIEFDPLSRGGSFSKIILVKTSLAPTMDTLLLEGINIPYPKDAYRQYPNQQTGLGFRTGMINFGQVFTNEPKIKYIDFFNFYDYPVQLNQNQPKLPKHIKARFDPVVVTSKTRAVLVLEYDGEGKQDLGFFEEEIVLDLLSDERKELGLKLIATVHEHFDPVPVTEVNNVPRLEIREREVDLSRIKSDVPISRMITLENRGGQALNIRKVVANCDCVSILLPKQDLAPGERTDVTVTFDPKGRLGIDHKSLTIFSNDPLQPTRTVMIKSRIN